MQIRVAYGRSLYCDGCSSMKIRVGARSARTRRITTLTASISRRSFCSLVPACAPSVPRSATKGGGFSLRNHDTAGWGVRLWTSGPGPVGTIGYLSTGHRTRSLVTVLGRMFVPDIA
eukprot:3935277-Rhodomonas_salina.2